MLDEYFVFLGDLILYIERTADQNWRWSVIGHTTKCIMSIMTVVYLPSFVSPTNDTHFMECRYLHHFIVKYSHFIPKILSKKSEDENNHYLFRIVIFQIKFPDCFP